MEHTEYNKKLKGHSVLMIGGIRDNISPIEQNFKLIVEALEKKGLISRKYY